MSCLRPDCSPPSVLRSGGFCGCCPVCVTEVGESSFAWRYRGCPDCVIEVGEWEKSTSLHLHCCGYPVCVAEIVSLNLLDVTVAVLFAWQKSVSLHLHDVTVAVMFAWQKSVSLNLHKITVAVLFAWQKSRMSLHLHCCDCPVCVTEVGEWEKSVSLHLHDVTVAVLSAWQKSVSDRSRWVFRCIIIAVLFAWQKCSVTEDGESSFALLWLSRLRYRNRWMREVDES